MTSTPPDQLGFVRGLLALARDDLPAAADTLMAHAQQRVTDGQAWRWAAFTAISLERWEAARTAALQAMEWRPRNAEMLQLLAVAQWKTGRLREAHDAAGRAFSIDPGMTNAIVIRSDVKRAMGDLDGAARDLQILLDSGRAGDDIYIRIARLHLQAGRYGPAHQALDQAAVTAPERRDLQLTRTEVLRSEGRLAEAHALVARVLERHPNAADAHHEQGSCYRLQENYEASVAAFERAVALSPELWQTWMVLGDDRRKLGRLEAARTALDRAAELAPGAPNVWAARGLVREAQGDLDGALADYDRGIAIPHASGPIFGYRAKLRSKRGDVEGALADHARAIALEPGRPHPLNERALTLMDARRYEEAVRDLTAALQCDPEYVFAWQNRGLVRMWMGDLEPAEADTRRALELAPDRAPLWYNLATILNRRGQGQATFDALTKCLELDPGHLRARGLRAQLLTLNGYAARAVKELQRVLKEAPPGWPERERYERALAKAEAALKGR